jgi:hypothetical protein
VKPAPVNAAVLIITGTLPVDVKVTDCVATVLTTTSPNATLLALMLNAGIAAFNVSEKYSETVP